MLLWEALLELLYPSKCVLCGKLLDGNARICAAAAAERCSPLPARRPSLR